MRRTRLVFVGAALLALVAGAAMAQGPGGPGGFGGPGGRQRRTRPQMQLRSTVQALGEMEKGKRCPLKPDQAKKIVAVIGPIQKQPKLTEDQAKAADKKIRATLTVQQLNEMSRISKEMRERRMAEMRKRFQAMQQGGRPGMGGPGMGGPGGPGGAGRPQFDRNAFKDFNPFLPPKAFKGANPQMMQRFQEGHKRLQEAIGALQKKAKQK